jgi:hypothetical protein
MDKALNRGYVLLPLAAPHRPPGRAGLHQALDRASSLGPLPAAVEAPPRMTHEPSGESEWECPLVRAEATARVEWAVGDLVASLLANKSPWRPLIHGSRLGDNAAVITTCGSSDHGCREARNRPCDLSPGRFTI